MPLSSNIEPKFDFIDKSELLVVGTKGTCTDLLKYDFVMSTKL